MLSFDKDGKVKAHCEGDAFDDGDCGHTHYRFQATDENGKVVASELVESNELWEDFWTDDSAIYRGFVFQHGSTSGRWRFFQTVFTAEEGDLTLSVSLGRVDNGKYKAMSDTAYVEFEAPDDLRAMDQTYFEYLEVLADIIGDYDENEDLERWLGNNESGGGRSIWNPNEARGWDKDDNPLSPITVMDAHLNNQLK